MNRKQQALEKRFQNKRENSPKRVYKPFPVVTPDPIIQEIKEYCKNAIYANKTGAWIYYTQYSNKFIQVYNVACQRSDYSLGYEEYWTQMEHLMIDEYCIQNSKLAKVLA